MPLAVKGQAQDDPGILAGEEVGSKRRAPEHLLVSRKSQARNTVIEVRGVTLGGPEFVVIAGPCSVESSDQLFATARAVKEAGAAILRGGAYKPRTSPYSFQGLGTRGLELLAWAREITGMPVVTEVMDTSDVAMVEQYTDIFQVGARNVQNYSLLRKLGQTGLPVLLKRGLMTTIKEYLNCAEYIMAEGNKQVILCERGIRTFETATRNTLDLSAVCVLKEMTHLPVVVDPSHAVGCRRFVPPLARAALAAGADGVMVEVHCSPNQALCDGDQSLNPRDFANLMIDLEALSQVRSEWQVI